MHFFQKLLYTKGLGHAANTVTLEKFVRLRSEHVAGNEEEALLQTARCIRKLQVELLAIHTGHAHIANHEVVGSARGASEGRAAVLENIHGETLIGQHVTHKLGDGGLVFENERTALRRRRSVAAGAARRAA